MDIIVGVLFVYMGKYFLFFLVGKDKIFEVVERYVKLVKFMLFKDMFIFLFMYGFILGFI